MRRLTQLQTRCPRCGSPHVVIEQTKTVELRRGETECVSQLRRYCRCTIGECLARFTEDVRVEERRGPA